MRVFRFLLFSCGKSLRNPVFGTVFLILLLCIFAPLRLPIFHTLHFSDEAEILNQVQLCSLRSSGTGTEQNKTCPVMMDTLPYFQKVSTVLDHSFFKIMATELDIKPGGIWAPTDCIPRQRVAIIVPYRDRLDQLQLFLQHMHPFLQAQKLNYAIIVVEQTARYSFNRGKLFNIGFVEATKDDNFCCFVFHDVDLFPESPKNIYECTKQPRHMCSAINTFRYVLPYPELFGGVVAFSASQFKFVNGYSNLYFGWGAEDDDLFNRVAIKGLHVQRAIQRLSRYTMLSHEKAVPNPYRYTLLASSIERMESDGLNSLHYRIVKKTLEPLYTHIVVDVA